jgi:hypothetical protein
MSYRMSYPIEPMKALSVQHLLGSRQCPRGDLNPLNHPLEAKQIRGLQRFGEFSAALSGHRGTPKGCQETPGRTCPTRFEPGRGGPVGGPTPRSRAASVDPTGSWSTACCSAPPTFANANPAATETARRNGARGRRTARMQPADHEITPNSARDHLCAAVWEPVIMRWRHTGTVQPMSLTQHLGPMGGKFADGSICR